MILKHTFLGEQEQLGHIKSMLKPSQKTSQTRSGDFKFNGLTKVPLSILIQKHESEIEPRNLHDYLMPQGNMLQVVPDQPWMSPELEAGQGVSNRAYHEAQSGLQSLFYFPSLTFPIHGGSRKRKKSFLNPLF